MLTVRPYKEGDRPYLMKICLDTSDLRGRDLKKEYFLLEQYCQYYCDHESLYIFVAADESDIPRGYIFCAHDNKDYAVVFRDRYLPLVDAAGLKYGLDSRLELLSQRVFGSRFRSHMHIDIEDGWRGSGTGTALLNALRDRLKSSGIHSIMLGVAAGNKNAIKFYRKNGFRTVLSLRPVTLLMGCDF